MPLGHLEEFIKAKSVHNLDRLDKIAQPFAKILLDCEEHDENIRQKSIAKRKKPDDKTTNKKAKISVHFSSDDSSYDTDSDNSALSETDSE